MKFEDAKVEKLVNALMTQCEEPDITPSGEYSPLELAYKFVQTSTISEEEIDWMDRIATHVAAGKRLAERFQPDDENAKPVPRTKTLDGRAAEMCALGMVKAASLVDPSELKQRGMAFQCVNATLTLLDELDADGGTNDFRKIIRNLAQTEADRVMSTISL